MDALIFKPHRRLNPQVQRGYVLLLTLITLVVLLFGVLFTMRGTLLQTVMTGNTAQRQIDVQTGDLALRLMQQNILTATNQGTQTLENASLSANSAPWFFIPPASALTCGGNTRWCEPDPAYWANCSSTSGTQFCWTLPNMAAGYSVKTVVVPTNQSTGGLSACGGNPSLTAKYYAIFLHVVEPNGKTSANTQTVFRLCV